jgi:hypothetical protein
VTYEGDNNVLPQQAANWLIRQLENHYKNIPVSSPLQTLSFLNDIESILENRFEAKSLAEVTNEQCKVILILIRFYCD